MKAEEIGARRAAAIGARSPKLFSLEIPNTIKRTPTLSSIFAGSPNHISLAADDARRGEWNELEVAVYGKLACHFARSFQRTDDVVAIVTTLRDKSEPHVRNEAARERLNHSFNDLSCCDGLCNNALTFFPSVFSNNSAGASPARFL